MKTMPDLKIICRLCMDSGLANDLHKVDIGLSLKINFCIDMEILPEDEISTYICNQCRKKIKKFYNFKFKCFKVDEELRANSKEMSVAIHSEEQSTVSPLRYDISNNSDDFINISECYRTEDVTTDENMENWINESVLGVDDIIKEVQLNKEIEIFANQYEQNNLNSQTNETEQNRIQCELCGIFEMKAMFRKHLFSHSVKDKSLQCKLCSKQFTRAENRMIHMRTHLGIRPFICEMCGQSSTKRQDLIRHMKIHSDERNHACPDCGRSFKRSSDLSCHIRTHTGVRPYKCRICEKDYTSHSGLRKHYKTHYKTQS